MNNNGVNNNVNNNTATPSVEPVLISMENQQQTQTIQQQVTPVPAPQVVQQPSIEEPVVQNVAVEQNVVPTPQQPTIEQPQPSTTTEVQQPVEQPAPAPQTTKEGIPLNHPQMIIHAAEIKNEEIPTPEQPQPAEQPKNEEPAKENKENNGTKKSKTNPILLLIIVGLVFYIIYSFNSHAQQIQKITYNCTPVDASKEETKLDLNSTLVKDLYSKVFTTIREDVAQPNFDSNTMRLYLAYRQIKEQDKYDTNCNLFSDIAMEPYKCEVNTSFVPKAFKQDTLILEWKKLFGEKTAIYLDNIKLENACIGGYEYIKEREEFVQGRCESDVSTSFKVTKELKEATSTKNMIILKEEVKYHQNEKMSLPDYLVSGTYYYTFRLDMNYNWIFIDKKYDTKY